ncbi:MAG: ABC transporter permease [Anaerolineae bacterium]|nr:ABC transporter permease [Anaerolineae bacterium]
MEATTASPVAQAAPSRLVAWRRAAARLLTGYTVQTVFQGIVTVWAVMTFTFILIRQMPSNPVEIETERLIREQQLSYDEARSRAAALFAFDPDQPILEQYVEYLGKLIRLDLGTSITSTGTQVLDQILQYLPWTLFSVGLGLLISFTIGIFVGMAMAYWRGGLFDNLVTAFASILFGIPNYIIALLIILILGVQLHVFSVANALGRVDPTIEPGFTMEYIGSVLSHALLPVVTYVSATVGGWILTMKSSTISTLGEEYVTVAHARGLPQRRVLTAYVGRNAMLPLVTRLAISIGFVVGGSVIIEDIYRYRGLGKFLTTAIVARDYTSMQGVFLVIAISVVVANTLADVLYGVLDPRVRMGKER